MKKRLMICCLALFLTACNTNTTQDELNTSKKNDLPQEEVTIEEAITEPLHPYEYDVDFVSDTFDHEDLIYFIMIDRFKDGDPSNNNFPDNSDNPEDLKAYLGGDLQGIIDQLDYIKSLGTTAIWLSPVAKNEAYGYHGYWIEDFYAVDPHFGSMATLQNLVQEAHTRDMKVILDYVVNHTGYNHPWVTDGTKKDWFHNLGDITNYNDKFQVENHNLAGLPDLNTENPQVKAYFFENALWWIRETGVDGFRLDTVKHVPQEFWNEFAYIIKDEYPDFFLLGEVISNSAGQLESYHVLGIDGLTNYALFRGIEDTFTLYGDANTLKVAIKNDAKFSNPEQNGIFLDNHDVNRLLGRTSKHGDAFLQQATTFVMTYPSIPIIYYGTEVGLEGKGDPDNRRLMPWDEFDDNPVYNYYLSMVELRSKTRDYTEVEILEAKSSHIVISYSNGEKHLITAFNVSEYDQNLSLDLTGTYKDYMTSASVDLDNLVLPGLSTLILLEE